MRSLTYSLSTAVSEVSVDIETGYFTVERFTDFSDAGTVNNAVTFHGQVEVCELPILGTIANGVLDACGARCSPGRLGSSRPPP